MGKGRHPGSPGQRPPLTQVLYVLRDVDDLVVTSLLLEPILGILAVGSGGCGIESNAGHGLSSEIGGAISMGDLPHESVGSTLYANLHGLHAGPPPASMRFSPPPMPGERIPHCVQRGPSRWTQYRAPKRVPENRRVGKGPGLGPDRAASAKNSSSNTSLRRSRS